MLIELPEGAPAGLNVCIVGGGLMGHALAGVFLARGADVLVCEADPEARTSLTGRVSRVIEELPRIPGAINRLRVAASLQELDPACALMIEAVPEDLPLKQRLFQELENLIPRAVLATNSSVYRVKDVAASMRNPERAIGTHWWNPPQFIPVVEVVQGERTPQELVNWMMLLLEACGKTPIHVKKDTPGFIGNRLQHALWREALSLVEEGVADAETVDLVCRSTLGLKLAVMGPIENADYVGLQLTRAIHEYVFPSLSAAAGPSPILLEALKEGKTGAKCGDGLLHWPEGRRERVGERLRSHLRANLPAVSRNKP